MNLHLAVRGVIPQVNPDIAATWKRSAGLYVTALDGTRTPGYDLIPVVIQAQAASGKDIERLNNLGIQGVVRKVYDYGNKQGIVRPDGRGGDFLMFPQVPGAPVQSWKITNVMETWPEWSAVFVVLQNDA